MPPVCICTAEYPPWHSARDAQRTARAILQVVITGSTRGLGLALANKFLQLGDKVVIASRTSSSVEQAVKRLTASHPSQLIAGYVCDVGKLGIDHLCFPTAGLQSQLI